MARVDFYVLADAGDLCRWQFACRLTEKVYRLRQTVHLLAPDRGAAERLDTLLWTWREGSFVPHDIVRPGRAPAAPVTIGYEAESCDGARDLLINLTDALPPSPDAFARIAEIVTSDDEQRRRSRARYAQYREQGHALETHRM